MARKIDTQVLEAFSNGRAHGNRVGVAYGSGIVRADGTKGRPSFWTDGSNVYSYDTCIGCWLGDTFVLNVTKYSATTANKQRALEWEMAQGNCVPLWRVDNVERGTDAIGLRTIARAQIDGAC